MMRNVQLFSYLQTVEVIFLKKKSWKNAYFSIIDPYRRLDYSSRDGENMLSLHVTPPVEKPQKSFCEFCVA